MLLGRKLSKTHFRLTGLNYTADEELADISSVKSETSNSIRFSSKRLGNVVPVDEHIIGIENVTSLPENIKTEDEHDRLDMENKYTKTDHPLLDRFFHELYHRKLDLNINFCDEEMSNIKDAVEKQIKILAQSVNEVDSRLTIGDIILVGSAKENTQIMKPCEFDFILTLDVLSKPGAVSIEQYGDGLCVNPNDCFFVKPKDIDTRSAFSDITLNGYIKASCEFALCRKGLKQLIVATLTQAISSHSTLTIKTNTGHLTYKHTKVKSHGPALMIRLMWNSIKTKRKMEISVDLCPAIKLNADQLTSISIESNIDRHHAYLKWLDNKGLDNKGLDKIAGSVLLIPGEGLHFRATYTETDLALTAGISEHHRKCYKILKYVVNGEPFPYEYDTCKINEYTCLQSLYTIISSYGLKQVLWFHHWEEKCTEENALGSCIYQMIKGVVSFRSGYTTKALNGSINDFWAENAEGFLSKRNYSNDYRINVLFNALQTLTDTDEYNFEACCKVIANAKMTAKLLIFCHRIINLCLPIHLYMILLCMSIFSLLYSGNKGIAVAGVGLMVLSCIICSC